MLASLNVAEIGAIKSLRLRPPVPQHVAGLRDARVGLLARFTDSNVPDPAIGRAMWMGFWDDEASLDSYLELRSPLTEMFEGGLALRMAPLRAHGAWPGFPTDLSDEQTSYEGPVIVMTLGLLRLRRSLAWTRASNQVQKQFLNAPGVIWAMGAAKPPLFAATITIWESAAAASSFAHQPDAAHDKAMAENTASPFMRQEIFARFRPVSSEGSLGPSPELAQGWLADRIG